MRKTDTVEKVRKPRAKKVVAEKPVERPEDLPEVVEETCPVIPEPAVTIDPPSDDPVEPEALSFEVFIARKSQLDGDFGFAPLWMPDFLFDFQAFLTDWNIRKGRSATFAGCGLGKTAMELVWAENVMRRTNKPTLILTQLAVSRQFIGEGTKFGVECKRIVDGQVHRGCVNVTNYKQLHKLNPDDFGGVACDESSAIKNDKSETRKAVNEFLRTVKYRLLATATAAPNDLPELGTSSEALGYLGNMDMLSKFFKNDRNNSVDTGGKWRGHGAPRSYVGPQWRFRGHAEEPFWRWVCSWARSLRKPSDFGFDDRDFILPPLVENIHEVKSDKPPPGMLFALPARGLREERAERRRTISERCEMAAALVLANGGNPSVSWCQLNDEGDMLEKLIPGSVQVSGKDSDESAEEKLTAFAEGQVANLVTKHAIGAYGLNWQHCAHMTSFVDHSYERDYQAIRRCYRFGQKRSVTVDRILSDGESNVLVNLRRKAEQADMLFENIVRYMRDALHITRGRTFDKKEELPSWL